MAVAGRLHRQSKISPPATQAVPRCWIGGMRCDPRRISPGLASRNRSAWRPCQPRRVVHLACPMTPRRRRRRKPPVRRSIFSLIVAPRVRSNRSAACRIDHAAAAYPCSTDERRDDCESLPTKPADIVTCMCFPSSPGHPWLRRSCVDL